MIRVKKQKKQLMLMKQAIFLTLIPIIGCASAAATREITAREFEVVRVIDGDTLKIMYDGELTSVRIFGINAPELRDKGGQEARHALEQLIAGKLIRIEFPCKRKRDNFGRLLCRVYADNLDVGNRLIEKGLATPCRKTKVSAKETKPHKRGR